MGKHFILIFNYNVLKTVVLILFKIKTLSQTDIVDPYQSKVMTTSLGERENWTQTIVDLVRDGLCQAIPTKGTLHILHIMTKPGCKTSKKSKGLPLQGDADNIF